MNTDPPPTTTAPPIGNYLDHGDVKKLVDRVREEDLGFGGIDITSEYTVPIDWEGNAVIRSRQDGVLAGLVLLPAFIEGYDERTKLTLDATDGQFISSGTSVARLTGAARSILATERPALNALIHLSGIATLTRKFVDAVQGTTAEIYDTRKTLPGLRALEKYAVACGGGCNHRFGLHEAVLVKDNHLAAMQATGRPLGPVLDQMIYHAQAHRPTPLFIEVEADTLDVLETVLKVMSAHLDNGFAGKFIAMIDNFEPQQMRQAAAIRKQLAPGVLLESSGGITLENVRDVALTGVDRIAIGAITHSAPALDIGLDWT